jgi:dTDP-L-rhamnose 4-epimerase
MIKNILVTGGAGFIGSNLVLSLVEKGYNITVLDNLSAQVHGKNVEESFTYNLIKGSVRFIKGDVRNRTDWEEALVDQNAVIHLAAETGTGQSMYQIYQYTDTNIGGTALLLDVLANGHYEIEKIILASSRVIYGEGRYFCSRHGDVFPLDRNINDLKNGYYECKCPHCGDGVTLLSTTEESKINPQSIYGLTKYNQEQLLLLASKYLGIPVVSFRYQNVYGPGQYLSNPYSGILPIFSTQILNRNPITIYEDGKESRDFVYIDDAVNATILGLENENANNNVYNVGTGRSIDVFQVATKLVSLFQSDIKVTIAGNYRFGDIRHNYADLTKICRDLKFVPKYQFEDGIIKFVKWVNSQIIHEDSYIKSYSELEEKGLII